MAAVSGTRRSRRSSGDVEDAILAATMEVLDEVGFKDLTVEAVAARAGAAKTAVYRRWPSKVPLVVEALTRSVPPLEVPDTGDLRQDLIGVWENASVGGLRSIERLMPLVTAYLGSDEDLTAVLRDRYFEPRLLGMRTIVTRAAQRGEIRPDIDPELAFDLLFGPLAYRLLRGVSPDAQTLGQLIDMAMQGLRPRGDQDA